MSRLYYEGRKNSRLYYDKETDKAKYKQINVLLKQQRHRTWRWIFIILLPFIAIIESVLISEWFDLAHQTFEIQRFIKGSCIATAFILGNYYLIKFIIKKLTK